MFIQTSDISFDCLYSSVLLLLWVQVSQTIFSVSPDSARTLLWPSHFLVQTPIPSLMLPLATSLTQSFTALCIAQGFKLSRLFVTPTASHVLPSSGLCSFQSLLQQGWLPLLSLSTLSSAALQYLWSCSTSNHLFFIVSQLYFVHMPVTASTALHCV